MKKMEEFVMFDYHEYGSRIDPERYEETGIMPINNLLLERIYMNAISLDKMIFNNIMKRMVAKEQARKIVENKIEESKDGILILDDYMPWKDIVLTSSNEKAKEILYAIFPSKRGGYNVVATPTSPGSFEIKKPFPKNWAGLENEELQKISGVDTITFCHKNLFICACKTYEDAIKIAKIAIQNK